LKIRTPASVEKPVMQTPETGGTTAKEGTPTTLGTPATAGTTPTVEVPETV